MATDNVEATKQISINTHLHLPTYLTEVYDLKDEQKRIRKLPLWTANLVHSPDLRDEAVPHGVLDSGHIRPNQSRIDPERVGLLARYAFTNNIYSWPD